MLSLLLFNHHQSVINRFKSDQESTIVVTPGPRDADRFRKISKFQNTVSMAGFFSQLVKDNLKGVKTERKSRLMFILATLWRQRGFGDDFEKFLHFFNTFTELRNNVLDEETFLSIAEDFPKEEAESLILASSLLEQLDIKDESSTYKLLVKLNDISVRYEKIVFYGFKYLNSIQVDLLKLISLKNNIEVVFPLDIYKAKEDRDWISWLDFDQIITIDEWKGSFGRVIRSSEFQLNKQLKSLNSEIDNFIFANQVFEAYKLQEVGAFTGGVKEPYLFLEGELEASFKWLRNFISKEKSLKKIKKRVQSIIKDCAEKKQYKKMKANILLYEGIVNFEEETDQFNNFDFFAVSLLEDIVRLNAPRISFVTSKLCKNLIPVGGLGFWDPLMRNAIYIGANTFDNKSQYTSMSSALLSRLSQIGVIKRRELEREYTRFLVKDFSSSEKNILFIEKGVIAFDSSEEAFNQANTVRKNLGSYLNTKQAKNLPMRFSASKLQTYQNCPQLFRYKYLESTLRVNEIKEEVTPIEEGRFEHLMIEEVVAKRIKNSKKYLLEKIESFLLEKKIKKVNKRKVKEDLLEKIERGILFIRNLIDKKNITSFEFEKKVEDDDFVGFIDFWGENDESVYIVDFKRSKASIPSQKSFLNFENVQLWSYLRRLSVKKSIVMGFACLDNLSESLFFSEESDFESYKVKKIKIDPLLEAYVSFERNLIQKIKNENFFQPKPKNSKVCDYCALENICEKE